MNKTGVFWRCLPCNMFAGTEEKVAYGVRESKERFTILICADAAGMHKCKPLGIWRSAQTHMFKGTKIMPLLYKANKRARINQYTTIDWFNLKFVEEVHAHCCKVGLPENFKIVLFLLDTC